MLGLQDRLELRDLRAHAPAHVPVLLRLMGRRAWYLPRWARRALPRVTFGHA